MYLLLSPTVIKNSIVNYQSVGREVNLISNINILNLVEESATVIVFYDASFRLQTFIDLKLLLDFKYIFIVNDEAYVNSLEHLGKTHLVNYTIVHGQFIKSIVEQDDELMRSFDTALSKDMKDEVSRTLTNPNLNTQTQMILQQWLSMYDSLGQACSYINDRDAFIEQKLEELLHTRTSVADQKEQIKNFVENFKISQMKFRSLVTLSVKKMAHRIEIPAHLPSIFIKDYGMPDLFTFIGAVYDLLVTSYDKYAKIFYVCDPDGITINLIPEHYTVVTANTQHAEILDNDFLACVGNVEQTFNYLTTSSAAEMLLIVDARKYMEKLFTNETMFINTAPDYMTVEKLNLDPEITVSYSGKSKLQLKEEILSTEYQYGLRNIKVVTHVVNSFLEKRGEI